jgi:rRNA maturation RNase YbeY
LIQQVIGQEEIELSAVEVIIVEDAYLKSLHKQFLKRDTFTDVMTFAWEENEQVEAEIYLSLDRAKINAQEYQVQLDQEIARLIIHGLLHVKGYNDEDKAGKQRMHNKEDEYLHRYWQNSGA